MILLLGGEKGGSGKSCLAQNLAVWLQARGGKQIYGLTNGPGKLCMAMNIDKSLNGEDLSQDTLYLEAGKEEEQKIVRAKRIGIDYAQEAKDYLWRFYLRDNPFVSAK